MGGDYSVCSLRCLGVLLAFHAVPLTALNSLPPVVGADMESRNSLVPARNAGPKRE